MSKKEQILETALHLFAEHGVDKTTTAHITQEAGVAEGTLFVHFKNKQALVDAVYLSIKKAEAEAFVGVLDENKSAEENVRMLGKTMVSHFVEHYHELKFILHVSQLGLVSEETRMEAYDHFAAIGVMMKQWQKRGELKNADVALLGDMLWSLIVTLVHHAKNKNKRVTGAMMDVLWDALKV